MSIPKQKTTLPSPSVAGDASVRPRTKELQTLETQLLSYSEKAYDDDLRKLAYKITGVALQLSNDELVKNADKIVKLVTLSMTILGKGAKQGSKPLVSIGIMSNNRDAINITS